MPVHSGNKPEASRGTPSLRRLHSFLLGIALAAMATVASAATGDIEIVSVRGDVRITAAGAEHAAKTGTTLDLPSTLRTGPDGATDLRQGDTTIGVGPGTQLDFPASPLPGAPVDRIVQPLGNAFYNVGPLGNRRLRVETPYLVAVIKGTQFNVAVEPDNGTISLYEGSLEILAPDIGATVQLNAGEIAIRHRGDDAIRVIPMHDRGLPAAPTKHTGANQPDADAAQDAAILGDDTGSLPDGSGPIAPIDPVEDKVTLDTEIDTGELARAQAGIDADIDLGAGTVDTSLDAGVDAGVIDVDAGVDAGVDLDTGTIDASLDTGVDAGLVEVDAGVDTGVDLGAGTVDAGVDVGLDAGPLDTEAGVDIGADLTGSDAGIDVGLEVLDTGIDIGLGGDAPLIDSDTTPDADDSGGLLDGILRRLGD